MTDFHVDNHGSVFLVQPLTQEAKDHLDIYAPQDEDHQYFLSSLVVEHRYIVDLVAQLQDEGFEVS